MYTGQCPVLQEIAALELGSLRNPERLLRYNSPDSPVRLRSNGYFAPTVICRRIQCAAGSRWCRSIRCFDVTPDSPVNYSGLAVVNSRSWRVPEPLFLGAPDTVRCTPDSLVNYSEAPLDFPEGDEFELESSGAPDTVRCTPDSHSKAIRQESKERDKELKAMIRELEQTSLWFRLRRKWRHITGKDK